MKEIRRRTRVVGAFPDGQSALMLVAARLRHIAGTKRYLDMDRLNEEKDLPSIAESNQELFRQLLRQKLKSQKCDA